ncbi:MAG TPA: family 78 glycoside hydrolase catalytic domain, partial [Holophaga sp.]|nr:family 78 glycoside hydrolase catalytic domain [Holophaga sp.]
GPAGATVRMIPGELLDKDGFVTQRSSGGPNSFSYTLKGQGREVWSPRFTYYGFRYVQVEGLKPENVEGQFVHLDAPRSGQFECSNTTFNRIHALIDAAVRSNLQHVLSDCPHREKLGWLEQTYLMGPSILYNWDLRSFLPKMERDMREAQVIDGLVPDIAPEYVTFGHGFRDSPEWGSAAVLVPWMAWQWYGDKRILEDAYPMMQRYSDYLESQKKGGLLSYGLGDWYDIGPKAPGYSQHTPQGVTATATYLEDLKAMRATATLLGKPQDAQLYATRYNALLAAFQKAFYQPAGPSYATASQTSLAVPLAMGLAPAAARPNLAEKLVADIRAKGNHTSAGDIGYHYVLAALLQAGRSDVIFD